MTIDWFKDIASPIGKYYKVPRESITPLPHHLKKPRHSRVIIFEKLEKNLADKGYGASGFTKDRTPNTVWMLEIIAHMDPEDSIKAFEEPIKVS